MLKSFSTQLAATAFFGPVGLAYTSMATAVLFTLILAVLYFTGFGALAILFIWPVSVVIGVLYVKFHNDRIRQSGNSLLLGPGQDAGLVSTVGSWMRGIAVLALICLLAYVTYRFIPLSAESTPTAPGRIVDTVGSAETTDVADTDNQILRTQGVDEAVDNKDDEAVVEGADTAPVITLTSRDLPKVIVDSSGRSTTESAGRTENGELGVDDNRIVAQPRLLYVDREVVNLRQGPGTQYSIVKQLDRNETLFEFARDGEWINIETETGNYVGWIHGNLVRR